MFRVNYALGERAIFDPGQRVRVANRCPVGHYRLPKYLRGKIGTVQTVIEPVAVDNEEEGFGRNAGSKRHYYRVAFQMTEVWPEYAQPADRLYIEIFESWLKGI
jgi:nitrile hydratase